jgi:hypothetical protein
MVKNYKICPLMSIGKDQKAGRLEYWKTGIMGFLEI